MLGTGKNQHLMPVIGSDEVRQQGTLVLLGHHMSQLCHGLDRNIAARHLHFYRILQHALRELANII